MFRSKKWVICPLAVALLFLGVETSFGQATGTFTGVVTDPSGAVIPNAAVSVTNDATNVTATTATNSAGLYNVPSLPPGFYTLKAEAKGFKALVNQHVELTVGYTQRVDFKLEVGATTQMITVESAATRVDTQTTRMSELVTARQVENLPLNGRNIFQLIEVAPGAVDTSFLDTEGAGSRGLRMVVNGARVNMNAFLINGVSDTQLSGGSATQPSVDTVAEFRVDTENLSAEYGSVVGSVTNIVTKSGSNNFHGDVYEFLRNDKLDAREFFEGKRNPFHMNQFGGTLGGPIIRDKLFFFGSYEGERTRTAIPQLIAIETPQWRNLVIQNAPNSVAAVLYNAFPGGPVPSSPDSLATYVTSDSGNCDTFNAACLQGTTPGTGLLQPYYIDPASPLGAAMLANPNLPTFGLVDASAPEEQRNQFYSGNQYHGQVDLQLAKDRVSSSFFYDQTADPVYTPATNGGSLTAFVSPRGFQSGLTDGYPHASMTWAHTFGPTALNELRLGYNRDTTDIAANNPGVPQIAIDTGEINIGNYNGYPQIFHENIYQLSDMVTLTRGKHTLKFGGNIQRNLENSEFNVGRPSVEFIDSVALAAGTVEDVAGGVDPGPIDPATGRSTGQAHLSSNIRAWRNWNYGLFLNDDWKLTPRFTLSLGLRYDIFSRHTEKYGHATELVLPPGPNLTERLAADNCYVNVSGGIGFDGQPCRGGFQHNPGALTTGDHNNFGPRFGFAWDVKGNGKTAVRGGFGVSYNGEVYNPLSNSRWDPPFYSFGLLFCGDEIASGQQNLVGRQFSDSCIFGPVGGGTPTFTGPPSNPGTGPAGATFNAFQGNIMGWNPWNANAAFLTGVVFPNFRDPYVFSSHLSVEHQFPGQAVVKLSWVGTFAHKLYRAEDINRVFGGRDTLPGVGPTNLGICSLFGGYRTNCLYGRIRTWENSVNSNYNALQLVLDKRMTHGLEWHASYLWSHSLDGRSTWHSGATTSNGSSEGFSMDQARPNLDYGNSIFDVRHRITSSFVWQLPFYRDQNGVAGHLLGGWQINNIISWHTGFHWTPYCHSSSFPKKCDFNRDGVSNDRPNQPAFGSALPSNANSVFEPDHSDTLHNIINDFFDPTASSKGSPAFCPGSPYPSCTNYTGPYDGTLGRNTFLGPNFSDVDFSIFKNIKVSERVSAQFRAEGFNIFNHTNLQMPQAKFGTERSVFGLAINTYAARQIQFALKLFF
jgi:outer membrane receptor protein involved in Fe transport